MKGWGRLILTLGLVTVMPLLYADGCLPGLPSLPKCIHCVKDPCCDRMGGEGYCDSSTGRIVCKNGFYSTCYCTRHAVMDIQEAQGCCLWQGGVLGVTPEQVVLCRGGGYSEECTRILLGAGQDLGIY